MRTFRGAKLLMTASIAASIIVFMPLAAFADGGDDGNGGADSPAISDTTPPVTSFTAAINTLQPPLRELVSDCNPGASAISVEALPDSTSDSPATSLLVSYQDPDGNVVDATIDQDFVNSCVAHVSPNLSATRKQTE